MGVRRPSMDTEVKSQRKGTIYFSDSLNQKRHILEKYSNNKQNFTADEATTGRMLPNHLPNLRQINKHGTITINKRGSVSPV